MTDSPLIILILFVGAAYLFKLWRDDMLAWKAGKPHEKGIPGATSAPGAALWIGAIGALALVGLETGGEIALGVSSEQTDITVIFLLAMIGAGVLEEVLFRGYFVIQNKGRNILILSIVGFSLLFALAHYQYYTEIPEEGTWRDLSFVIDPKSGWSLLLLFLNSLWFYWMRFSKWNPHHSLLPCFVAHIASNMGVFAVKLLQGHVHGLY
ncbi:CPBP family intramembrane metalloprotease [Puniceicoccales bacterium CK1056]|uniref:CPBP family intramembrane metalloprotease n=1 Tax=Oceanipulchritudo coccoides TaxID=2706888 RepID=A0A6B2LYB0_9BACT|nr:CPBP family intramembrane glutamic endopeptidase [Oceanipulchritudo coccoides]NDV61343.1 CPBP family intramembrane metalloprotease [Oceanipulchritudo coccoides]